MSKTTGMKSKPNKSSQPPAKNPDDFVSGSGAKMKRLTLDVSEDLHRRIKLKCVQDGDKMADRLREILEREFA